MSDTVTNIVPPSDARPQEGGAPPRMPAPPVIPEGQRPPLPAAAREAVERFFRARYARSESARRLMDEALAESPDPGAETAEGEEAANV